MNQNRPWGEFKTLHQVEDCQVNVIKMNPKESSNKHYHKLSCETYIIVSGQGELFLDDEQILLKPENIAEIEDMIVRNNKPIGTCECKGKGKESCMGNGWIRDGAGYQKCPYFKSWD